MMDAYIWEADVYCAACGEAVRVRLTCDGVEPDEDSGSWPQGPYPNGGGEADSPQHCGACHVFLENPLTGEGRDYVRDMAQDPESCSDVVRTWLEFYEIELTT